MQNINNAWTRGEVGTVAPYFHDDVVVAGPDLKQITRSNKPQIHSDGIALDKNNEFVYYQALTGHSIPAGRKI